MASSTTTCRFVPVLLVAGALALSAPVYAQNGRKGTQCALSIAPSPSIAGQTVKLTVVVTTRIASDRPRGAVHLFADGSLLQILPLSTAGEQSEAVLELNTLAAGTYRITARYAGHPEFFPSGSVPFVHVVKQN